jgi:hypothetical protein
VIRGTIYVRISLYAPKAKKFSQEIAKLKIPIDETSRAIAILQIAVDKQQAFGIVGDKEPDFDTLNKELIKLETRPWQDIDSFDLIDPQDNQLEQGAFYMLRDKKELATRNVNIAFSLDKSFADTHGQLLPLFWHLTLQTSANIHCGLYDQLGFYGIGTSHRPKNRMTTLVQHYRAASDITQNLDDIQGLINDMILDLNDNNAYIRMTSELRSVSLSVPDRMFPDPMVIFERTGVILGAKGWKRIATDKNCALVLSHMKVTVSSGRNRSSVKISSILDSIGS